MTAAALERNTCSDTLEFPSKSGEVTSKDAYLDGTGGSAAGVCVLRETSASFVDSDGADCIVPLKAAVPVFSVAIVGVDTLGEGVEIVDVATVDEASAAFKLPVRGSTEPTASAAFATSAALLSISSIRRWTMAGISFTYVPMSRWLERISFPAQLSTQCS